MCGRYNFTDEESAEIQDIIRQVQKKLDGRELKTGDIYPTNLAAVITEECPTAMVWGFPNPKGGIIINARSETVLERPMFRRSVLERRCLIPTTGFYEWGTEEDGQLSLFPDIPKPKGGKQKYLFRLPAQKELYMAGFYNRFYDEDRFVVLTTEANDTMRPIHNRMPVVLRPDEREKWLSGKDLDKLFNRDELLLEYQICFPS